MRKETLAVGSGGFPAIYRRFEWHFRAFLLFLDIMFLCADCCGVRS